MSSLINWLKTHKALTVILIVVAYFVWQFAKSFFGISLLGSLAPSTKISRSSISEQQLANPSFGATAGIDLPSFNQLTQTDSTNASAERMVVQNSYLSLLVKDVRESGDKVLKYAKDNGGYMVTTSYNRPSESPFATITIRVPSAKFDDALNNFRSLALKVTNENLVGTDVTDQYEDIEARLETLEKTKAKFLSILEQAVDVDDLLRVNREIINIQTQIDSYRGRKLAMEKEVAMAKITVYLSTDELSLPYTPDNKFRPQVVFKLAVRSLLNTLSFFGKAAIWIGVYSIIWLPVVLIIIFYRRYRRSKAIKVPKVQV